MRRIADVADNARSIRHSLEGAALLPTIMLSGENHPNRTCWAKTLRQLLGQQVASNEQARARCNLACPGAPQWWCWTLRSSNPDVGRSPEQSAHGCRRSKKELALGFVKSQHRHPACGLFRRIFELCLAFNNESWFRPQTTSCKPSFTIARIR